MAILLVLCFWVLELTIIKFWKLTSTKLGDCLRSIAMDHSDDLYKERMAALLRAIYAAKCVKDDNAPSQIEEGLYLGSVGSANNKILLKSLNITHILTVATSIPPAYPNDFTYKVVDVSDREEVNIAQFFDECFCFINEAKRKGGVLVHCFVGRSRSVTIVVAYLMKKHGMSLSEALNVVKSKRSVAAPNSGFMSQLKNYEKSLQDLKMNPNVNNDVANVVSIRKRKRKRKSPLWDEDTHMTFLKLCMDELRKGNKLGTHFNKTGYENLIKEMEEQKGKKLDYKQIKNHWEQMRGEWRVYDRLMRIESGIRWDSVRKTIDVTPEWWDEKIKEDPHFEDFRDANLEMYKMYYEPLFRDSIAVGDITRAHAEFDNMIGDAYTLEGKGDSDEVNIMDNVAPLFLEGSSSIKKKSRKGKTKASTFDERLDTVLQAISSCTTQTFQPQNSSASTKDCMNIVSCYPGFEEGSDMYCEALSIFLKKQARENFMVPTNNDAKMKFLKFMIDAKKKGVDN